jgi:hypothetical protein
MRFAFAVVALLAPSAASASERSGFTTELAAGLGYALFVPDYDTEGLQSKADVAVVPASISVGGFVSDKLAIVARTASVARQPRSRFEVSSIYGAGAQLWVSDSVYVGAAAGLALYGRGIFSAAFFSRQTGFGGELRVGYAFMRVPGHAFSVYGAWMPAYFAGSTEYIPFALHGVTIAAEWQLGG